MADGIGVSVRTVACTVVAHRDLPAATVLARSYLRHHPDHDFVILLTDVGRAEPHPEFRTVGHAWLDVDPDEYLRTAACCPAGELTAAVRPLLVRQLLGDYDVVLCLAADGLVLAPFPDVAEAAREVGIVLAPLTLGPLPADGREPGPGFAARTGGFDPGFLAVGRAAKPFVDFWLERARDAVLEPIQVEAGRRQPIGQAWLAALPALFEHLVIRDPGFPLGYWNLHERELGTGPDGGFTVAGCPARFVRFTGYDPDQPWLLSTDCADRPRVLLSGRPVLRQLCASYRDQLGSAGKTAAEKYRFGTLPNGAELTASIRGVLRDAWREAVRATGDQVPFAYPAEEVPPHPFGADHGAGFVRWLRSPASPGQRAAGLHRLAMWLWSHRTDLRMAFPEPLNGSAAGFRDWCRTHGVAEGSLPEWAAPDEPPAVAEPVDEFGVNLTGYLTAELGLGELSRVLQRAVAHARIPLVSVVEDHSLAGLVRTGLDRPDTVGRPRFPVTVIAVNADYTALVLGSHPEIGHHRYRIGLWAWELEDYPAELRSAFGLVDEVWTISEFCRTAIARHATVPVEVFPMPVPDPGEPRRATRRPGDPVRFLFTFDFNSTGQRKNPWGAVTAFRRAFPARDDVRLVVKATNAHRNVAAAERLRCLIGDDPRIELLERYLSVPELDALYADADAYVSLHRSEGFGLTVAEAMIRGIPVIATDYSATTEFVTDRVGWPIPYTMEPVGPGWPPYPADGRWARPDLDEAAHAMCEVADNPTEAVRRGAAAREHLLRTRSMDTAAEWVRARLSAAYVSWQRQGGGAMRRENALDAVERITHATPDPHSPSRLPFAPALRKLVYRAINHYDAHQRAAHEAIARAAREQDRRLADIERRLAELESGGGKEAAR